MNSVHFFSCAVIQGFFFFKLKTSLAQSELKGAIFEKTAKIWDSDWDMFFVGYFFALLEWIPFLLCCQCLIQSSKTDIGLKDKVMRSPTLTTPKKIYSFTKHLRRRRQAVPTAASASQCHRKNARCKFTG